ncbi:site-specific integrase [Photobacterium atrarenae]|uniref:Site-specific integrase n=1 Tax=Photobacterium atrarenae TaxID=865757 RepID=A0ABY5GH41_9GAMM|nr:site-specific integrase [Photobacterium atrarenae]UTV28440.1 site-specific integrase [Photobacterium atrarenae]
MATNLWLSPHGFWYFRKVNLLPSGKRKETRKSLRTRCKRTAKEQVIKLLTCDQSSSSASTPAHLSQCNPPSLPVNITPDYLSAHLERYLVVKAKRCCERELLTIGRYIRRYITYLRQDEKADATSSATASSFLDSLTVAVPTKNKHASKIGWLDKRSDIEINNPFSQLKEKHPVASQEQRKAYSLAQAQLLIEQSSEFDEWKRWDVLLGRYTGMRCNEICQLHRDDIVQVEGIWCVSFNQDHDYKRLKTACSKRILPLPVHLPNQFNVDDFQRFVMSREGRLFPEATIYKGNCAQYFGKWFNRWRKKHHLPEFHSLRHLVATELKQAGQPEQFAAAILGHSHKNISFGRYGKSIPPKRLQNSMKAIAVSSVT